MAAVTTAALTAGLLVGPALVGPTGSAGSVGVSTASAAVGGTCEPDALIGEPEWGPAAIGRDAANALADGAGVRVAVVDSGVQATFPHLVGAVEPGRDVVAKDPEDGTGTRDIFGHGSAVATIIAGRRVEGSALVGIAPAATIVPFRVYYEDDSDQAEREDKHPTPARIAAGIREAAAAGVRVIVVAMSTAEDNPELAAAVADATAGGALVISSMGNATEDSDPTRPRYPAAYPEVLAVGAFDQEFTPVLAYRGDHVDVAAPGVGVLTTGRSGGDCLLGTTEQATSWATAHVGGVAALVAQTHPEETPAQWAYRITATAARTVPDERSDLVGWGLVQAPDAIAFVDDGSARGPVSGAVPAVERPVAENAPVVITSPPDPWADARGTLAWWALGAAVVVAASLVVARTPSRRSDQGN
ncbi:serine protease [Serinibacter arcticus]|uniref:Serine protease n=1 Tax=Serinibacter arcticus TaxID=1655435 RepID=A0A4Z1EAA6_9MICO|nr:serine protease [Serinibacter arcticus]